MTLITLPSGTVLANDYTLPIIVISKVLIKLKNLLKHLAVILLMLRFIL